ncbi:MAG: NADH-quinone oxidoreductase subunit NuoE [Alphaproteobacteria bacterium]|nr:MAG: NADH-quinone oxidoreductase subunit NuoE [Alphaproteobacteria bacterium]
MKPIIAPDSEQPKSFSFLKKNEKLIKEIISRYPKGRQKSAIMPLLDLTQRQMAETVKKGGGWIPRAAMDEIARIVDVAPMKIYEVATFYSMYNLRPVGKYNIQCCTTTPCWLSGSSDIVKTAEKELGIKMGQTTKDQKFTLTDVECMGACANAPMVQVNDDYYEDLTPETMQNLLSALSKGNPPKKGPQNGRIAAMPLGGPTSLEKEAKKAKVV